MSERKTLGWGMFALLLAALLAGCTGSGFASGPVGSTPRQFGDLEFTLSAPKSRFMPGEAVSLTFTARNTGTQTITVHFGSPVAQRLQIKQGNQVVWQFPPGTAAVGMTLTFAPGETKTFTQDWDQRLAPLGAQAIPGTYQVTAWLDARQIGNQNFSLEEAQAQLYAHPIEIML